MNDQNVLKRVTVISANTVLLLSVLLLGFSLTVHANNPVYENHYNICEAIAYAEKYAYTPNSAYEIAYAEKDGKAVEEDCTNFVSQCLVAGGIPENSSWNSKTNGRIFIGWFPDYKGVNHPIYRNYSEGYNTFVNAGKLNEYLAAQGYSIEKSVNVSDNTISVTSLSPVAGDIVQFDWDGDGKIDHSVLCCGYNENGELCYASHSDPGFMKPFSQISSLSVPIAYSDRLYGTVIYLIHMTDTAGLKDVTSRYINKVVAIKSVEVGQYVSSGTGQDTDSIYVTANSGSLSNQEYYIVVKGDNGKVGLRSLGNDNFLSARLDIDASAAPISACYGRTYKDPLSWESLRIYEKDGVQYIQFQSNGKWLQVNAEENSHPLKACGRAASTWERFILEEITSTESQESASIETNASASEDFSAVDETPSDSGAQGVSTVSQAYGNGYNEGWYTGEWSNGAPNGWGKLEYIDYNGDGKFYTVSYGGETYNALYYEGNFSDGARYGFGTVVYEDGWKEEGIYYGSWEAGKKVFEGKLWHKDGEYYWEGYLTATSNVSGEWTWY